MPGMTFNADPGLQDFSFPCTPTRVRLPFFCYWATPSASSLLIQALSCCAGCCWADGTGSPHQSAEAPWHWHTNPESIHARPYCQALWALIPSTTASGKPVPHHRNSRWRSAKAWHLRQPQSSHKLKGCRSVQLHTATKPVQWETKTPLVLPFIWWETRTKHCWKRGGHSGSDRRSEKKAAPKNSTHPWGSEMPGTVAKYPGET